MTKSSSVWSLATGERSTPGDSGDCDSVLGLPYTSASEDSPRGCVEGKATGDESGEREGGSGDLAVIGELGAPIKSLNLTSISSFHVSPLSSAGFTLVNFRRPTGAARVGFEICGLALAGDISVRVVAFSDKAFT